MRHLAIECSSVGGSVSLLDGPLEICGSTLDNKNGSVQGLAILIQSILASHGEATVPPLLISVTSGPGSFTGLRVGLATAKSLGFAWNIPLVAVDTLHAIALRTANSFALDRQAFKLVTVINAFRKQLFVAGWQVDSLGRLHWQKSSQVVDAGRWISQPWESLSEPAQSQISLDSSGDGQILRISGPGLRNCVPSLVPRCELASNELWEPRSTEVGQIGWEKYVRGEFSSAASLTANYIRSSAAEEKR